jgi:hypothetical protein
VLINKILVFSVMAASNLFKSSIHVLVDVSNSRGTYKIKKDL